MKKLAIKFHDNDFWSTFHAVLWNISKVIKDNEGNKYFSFPDEKEKILKIINILSPGMYAIHQSLRHGDIIETEIVQTSEWLHKIKVEDLLVDNEVDKYVNSDDEFFNGETFILDTTIPNHYIYSV